MISCFVGSVEYGTSANDGEGLAPGPLTVLSVVVTVVVVAVVVTVVAVRVVVTVVVVAVVVTVVAVAVMITVVTVHPGGPPIVRAVVWMCVVGSRGVTVCADHRGREREPEDGDRHEQPSIDVESGHYGSNKAKTPTFRAGIQPTTPPLTTFVSIAGYSLLGRYI